MSCLQLLLQAPITFQIDIDVMMHNMQSGREQSDAKEDVDDDDNNCRFGSQTQLVTKTNEIQGF